MKLLLITVILPLVGCATVPDTQPVVSRSATYNGTTANSSYGNISSTIVHTSKGSVQMIRNGSTTTISRISK